MRLEGLIEIYVALLSWRETGTPLPLQPGRRKLKTSPQIPCYQITYFLKEKWDFWRRRMGILKKKKSYKGIFFRVSLMNQILPSLLKTGTDSFEEDFQQFPFMLILLETINVSQISLPLKSICSQSKKCKFFSNMFWKGGEGRQC